MVVTQISIKDSLPANPNAPSFLLLPPGIRNIIFKYLLTRPKHYYLKTCTTIQPSINQVRNDEDTDKLISLFRLCNRLYHKASSILYKENHFVIRMHDTNEHDIRHLKNHFDQIGLYKLPPLYSCFAAVL
jgi:hypothetical protein